MINNRPWTLVTSKEYFSKVMHAVLDVAKECNLTLADFKKDTHNGFLVRFGLKGYGVHPHFQIENEDGSKVWRYRANLRDASLDKDEPFVSWNPDNLSIERFSYWDVLAMRSAIVK